MGVDKSEVFGQERLFLVDPLSGGELVRHADTAEATLLGRNVLFIEVLDLFAQANAALALPVATKNPAVSAELTARYGSSAEEVASRAGTVTAPKLLKLARWHFAQAHGMFERIAEAPADEEKIKAETKREYEAFKDKYFGTSNAAARKAHRTQLLEEIRTGVLDLSQLDRDQGLRPHDESLKLSSAERLQAILEDPRAHFLPATNLEKTIVMSWLDYLDNPEYPLGVTNQLIEVFNRQSRLFGNTPEIGGERAKESIVYEVADFARDARKQAVATSALLSVLMEPLRPDLLLGSEISLDDIALRAMCRFHDGRAAMTISGPLAVTTADPLRTVINRWTRRGPGRHKVVEDGYTSPNIKPNYLAQIQFFSGLLTIKEARRLASMTYQNELRRQAFHETRLREIAGNPGVHQDKLRAVAREELQAIEKESRAAA